MGVKDLIVAEKEKKPQCVLSKLLLLCHRAGRCQPDRAGRLGDAHQRACARRKRARNRRAASCLGLWAVSLLVAPRLGLWLSPLLGPAPVLGLAPPLVVSSPNLFASGQLPARGEVGPLTTTSDGASPNRDAGPTSGDSHSPNRGATSSDTAHKPRLLAARRLRADWLRARAR